MARSTAKALPVEMAPSKAGVEEIQSKPADVHRERCCLTKAVDEKIEWVAGLIRNCSNPSELFQLISLSDQLLSLHKRLHEI